MLSKRPFGTSSATKTKKSAEGQTRTVDTGIFSAVLYHLSYLGAHFHYRIRRGQCQGGGKSLPLSTGQPHDADKRLTASSGKFRFHVAMLNTPQPATTGRIHDVGGCTGRIRLKLSVRLCNSDVESLASPISTQ